MKRSYIGLAVGALVALGAALSLPSCGHDQKLVSLTIQPTSFTFLDPYSLPPATNITEQYTATATYIHPPETKDVTSQATWKVDDGVVTMTTPGFFTPAPGYCGGGTISATMLEGTGGSSNIVTAYATATVDNPAVASCPGYGTISTLNVGISGNGSVTSLPSGISCPGTCSAEFPVGSSVLLTANGTPFVNWTNCTSGTPTSPQCAVTIVAGGVAIIANF
jgi:hypothetical protein